MSCHGPKRIRLSCFSFFLFRDGHVPLNRALNCASRREHFKAESINPIRPVTSGLLAKYRGQNISPTASFKFPRRLLLVSASVAPSVLSLMLQLGGERSPDDSELSAISESTKSQDGPVGMTGLVHYDAKIRKVTDKLLSLA